DAGVWEKVAAAYPYSANESETPISAGIGTKLPALRADWFLAVASRPPLYHQLLQLPNHLHDLEDLLGVNMSADLQRGRVARAGFTNSGETLHNRMIERHESPYGAVWLSFDFFENAGAQNLLEHPLGPGGENHFFKHAGNSIIFSLPNGLQGYMVV